MLHRSHHDNCIASLAALYDRSDGFYRRQIALQVKNKDQDRIDDTKLGDKLIYGAYVQWCQENVEKPLAEKTFTQQLRKDAEILGITYDKNLDTGGGKKARGYHGINVMVNTENRFL